MEITTIILFCLTFTGIYSYPIQESNSPYCFHYDFKDDKEYKQYLAVELKQDAVFKSRWNQDLTGVPNTNHYTENELRAIRTYTGDCVYQDFNTATRNLVDGKINYDNYPYKALHNYLSSVIEKSKSCYSSLYRGVSFKDTALNVGDKFKFKQFASSSLNYQQAKDFSGPDGTIYTTDGTIYTILSSCTGADISKYSCYAIEEEVLIPPCSEFTVTNITAATNSDPRLVVLNEGDTFRKVTTTWFFIIAYSVLFQL